MSISFSREFPRKSFLSVCLMLFCSQSASRAAEPVKHPLVVAHRGLLRHAPENTLANFRACLQLRVGFELDVRRSKDGVLVCVHDGTVDRTSNGKGNVSDLTLAELKKLDAGSWFSPDFRDQRIPTLDEVFQLVARNKKPSILIAVDIKGEDQQIEADTVKLAEKHNVLSKLLFIGRTISEPAVRKRLRQANSKTHVASLANEPQDFAAALADKQADWVYVRFLPTAKQVKATHVSGKKMFIAGPTVAGQEVANWQKASAVGLDAILTDYALDLSQVNRNAKSN